MIGWPSLSNPLRGIIRFVRGPRRLRLYDGLTGDSTYYKLRRSARIGYGEECELSLDGADTPPVLFEVRQEKGPLVITTPLDAITLEHRIELSLDGERLSDENVELLAAELGEGVLKVGKRRFVQLRFRASE